MITESGQILNLGSPVRAALLYRQAAEPAGSGGVIAATQKGMAGNALPSFRRASAIHRVATKGRALSGMPHGFGDGLASRQMVFSDLPGSAARSGCVRCILLPAASPAKLLFSVYHRPRFRTSV